METMTATDARAHLFEILRDSLGKHKQFRVPYKKGSVVIMSEEDYESLLETLYLLSAPGFRKAHRKARREIQKGHTVPFHKAFPES